MVYEGIFSSLKLRDEDLASIWKHSLYVACASKMLALRTGKQDPERVFTVALLHDIGMVPFFMFDPRYRDIVRVIRRRTTSAARPGGIKRGFSVSSQRPGCGRAVLTPVALYAHERGRLEEMRLLLQ
jgi:hypothetical protein